MRPSDGAPRHTEVMAVRGAQGFAAQTTAYTSRVSESRGCVMVGKSIIGGCYTGLLAIGCDLRYRCKQHSVLSMFSSPVANSADISCIPVFGWG